MTIQSIEIKELFSVQQISDKVISLAQTIQDGLQEGPLVVVVLLKGAMIFAADLIRKVKKEVIVDFMIVRSYEGTHQTGAIEIRHDITVPIKGQQVLVIEDIVDTGLTLHRVLPHLWAHQPQTLRTCSFLDKPGARRVDLQIDYVGFQIDDLFVVGYGMDFNQRYRNLPYVGHIVPKAS